MNNFIYMVNDLNDLLDKLVGFLSLLLLFVSISLFIYLIIYKLILVIKCLWHRDSKWREHAFDIMMTSDFFKIAYFLNYHADKAVDKIDQRADLIDKALSEGKDPYKAVRDAKL